ncbi:MAG: 16S rRNA (guanine(527)-N(7))-methyltransferase RsmG [Phycisphaerales bacterium]
MTDTPPESSSPDAPSPESTDAAAAAAAADAAAISAAGTPAADERPLRPSIGPAGPPTPEMLEAASDAGIAFEDGDVERLERYLDLLFETNRRFNLTRIEDPAQAWMRHIFDSLTLLPWIMESGAKRLLDVGSGGGLPGIPLAIVLPDVRVTLVETTGKKADFLDQTATALELTNVQVENGRAETMAHDRDLHREQYDIVTARAVGRLPTLLEWTVPFVRVGGLVLAIKGEQAEDEVFESKRALHELGAVVVDQVRTPTGTIVVIEKTIKTSRHYPRAVGEAKRKPL